MKRATTSTRTSAKKKTPRGVAVSLVAPQRESPVRATRPRVTSVVEPKRSWSLPARLVAFTLVLFFVLVPIGDAYADTSEVVVVDVPAMEVSEPEATAPQVEIPLQETEEVAEIEAMSADTTAEVENEAHNEVHGDEPVELVIEPTEPALDESEVEVDTGAETDGGGVSSTDSGTEDEQSMPVTILPTTTPVTTTPMDTAPTEQEHSVTSTTTEPANSTTDDTATSTIPVPEEPDVPAEPEVSADIVSATTTEATTTEEVATTTEPASETSTHTTDADRFTFGVSECVAVGNGAFQCVRSTERGTEESARGPLYAAKDQSGDMEIYISNEDGIRAITQNDYDDDAPSVDPVTGDIVWHALIDDRSQIMHYDSESGAGTRITKEAYNSMQPSMYDGDIVFQSWIGNDWEIVLVDDTDGREILTDNDTHDIAPSITKEYIMWQAFDGAEWVGKVYDRSTKDIETVHGLNGGKVENPRMIMVFDSTVDNGDTETLGYDPISGEVVSLAVTPVPYVPERIPEPEPEQEEKALVQPSVTTRTETKNATSTDPTDTNTDTNNESIGSSTAPVLEVATTTGATVEEISTDSELTLDLSPVEPLNIVPEIPDLVVPAFSSSVNDEATTSPTM